MPLHPSDCQCVGCQRIRTHPLEFAIRNPEKPSNVVPPRNFLEAQCAFVVIEQLQERDRLPAQGRPKEPA